MNLINCTHNCVHQSDGYCTLDSLSGACVSPIEDCIYYCSASAKKPPQLGNISYRDKL